MASPLNAHRQRLARHSVSTTPVRGSPLARSPSTPYDVYRAQHNEPAGGGMRMGSGSRFTSGSAFGGSSSANNGSVFASPSSPSTYGAAYRRNVGFGSPGARASPRPSQVDQQATLSNSSGKSDTSSSRLRPRVSNRFVRRKPLKQRLMEMPREWYDKVIFSEYLDFSNPEIGYPLGIAMHVMSLLVLMAHPDGSLHYTGRKAKTSRPSSLFTEQQMATGLASRRRVQKESAWRWTAGLVAFLLLVAAIVNAVNLFTARRRYQLWLKSTAEAVQSDHASLVDIPADVDATRERSLHEVAVATFKNLLHSAWRLTWWTAKKILWKMRSLSYIGIVIRIIFSLFSRFNTARQARHASSTGPQMHVIDVWQAPEMSLRLFCLYSPLHALVYLANIDALPLVSMHASSTVGGRISGLIAGAFVMALVSAQTTLLAQSFAGLVKDKSIIAGEVLHEYDQKFVVPRAMPACRDASTMTMQAEMIDPSEWMNSEQQQYSHDDLHGPQNAAAASEPNHHHFYDHLRRAPGFGRSSMRADAATQAMPSPSRSTSTPRKKGRQTMMN